MRIKKLLFLIPTIAFLAVALFFFVGVVPSPAHAADDVPTLDLPSFERQYGDFVLDKTKWTYSPAEDVFISYGNVIDGKFVPLNKDNNGGYDYVCKLNLLVVDENGDISASIGKTKLSKPYDNEGNCILNPNPAGDNGGRTYRLYQGSFKRGSSDVPFATIFETESGDTEGLALANYSSEAAMTVKRRQINVGILMDNIPDGVVYELTERSEDLKTIKDLKLFRTFSLEIKLTLEDVDFALVFGHTLQDFSGNKGDNNGMYLYDNVGLYDPFTLENDNVVIVDREGNNVTDYYEITSDFNVQVEVEKLHIVAPVYNFENVYLQSCIDLADIIVDGGVATITKSAYNLTNLLNMSTRDDFKNSEDKIHYLDHNGNILANFDLSVVYSYLIITSLDYFTPVWGSASVYSLYVNESDYNPNLYYDCVPVLVSVDGFDKVDGLDGKENFELVFDDSYASTFRINKRTIVLYGEGEGDIEMEDGVYYIPVSTGNFSKPYGYAYSESSFAELRVDTDGDGETDTEMQVTFKIENFASFLNNPKFYSLGDKVILNVGNYAIVPENITDWRYNATIHSSLHYTVTQKELTLNELFESQSFVGHVDHVNGTYIIGGFNYDCDPSEYEIVELKFSQKLPYSEDGEGPYLENDPVFTLKFTFGEQTRPGVYSSTGLLDETSNFVLTDLVVDETNGAVENVAIRIFNKLLEASVENIEYDGTTPEIVISGAVDGLDYEITKSYATGSTYNVKNAVKGEPVGAGTYTVRVQLKESDVYAFEGGLNYIDLTFKIAKRKIVVTVKAKGDKTFGTEGYFKSANDSNIATYTVAYGGEDKSKPGLIKGDTLGNLTSKAAEKTAKPGTYDISTSNLKNDNYEITFLDSSGAKKAEKINVVKLTKEIPELTSFAKGNACVIKVTDVSITLSIPTLFGIQMSPFGVTYRTGDEDFTDENVKITNNSVEITGLSEGTTYTIKYTIKKSNDYISLSKDCVVEIEVSTILTPPEAEQNIEKTTDTEIFVNVYNYQDSTGKYFAIIEDYDMFAGSFRFDIPSECISIVNVKDEDGNITSFAIFDIAKAIRLAQGDEVQYFLTPGSEYVLYVLREKDFALQKGDQEPLYVSTAYSKPDLKKSDVVVGDNMIYLNLGEEDDEDVYVIEYIIGSSKTTITSILDDVVDLSPIFQKEGAEILFGDGLVISDTLADRIYYLKIYKEKRLSTEDGEIVIKSAPIYFEIHTPRADGNMFTRAVENISGYLGVITMVVLLIALVIFIVLYSKLRRKWRIS